MWPCLGQQATFCFCGFLDRVSMSSPVRSEASASFITGTVLCMVDADKSNTDRVTSTSPEMRDLFLQIADDSINLLDHCLLQDFDLDADLNCRNLASGDRIPRIDDRILARDNLAECSIATSSLDPLSSIGCVQNPFLGGYMGVEFDRLIECNQVLVQMHRHKISKTRIAMQVRVASKEILKFGQKPIRHTILFVGPVSRLLALSEDNLE